MESQVEQVGVKIKQLESDIAYCKEVLQKAEKYERLMEEPDFKDFLKDFGEGFSVHEMQIETALDSLTDASPRQQEELFRIILVHQSKKETVQALLNRPSDILKLAATSRKNLPVLEDQLRQAQLETANA